MAQTVIEGTKEQIRPAFDKQSEKQRMKLIIVEEDTDKPSDSEGD